MLFSIHLKKYVGGPATEQHLRIIFMFYSTIRGNGVTKTEVWICAVFYESLTDEWSVKKAVKIPGWAFNYFDAIDKEKLLEASFVDSNSWDYSI